VGDKVEPQGLKSGCRGAVSGSDQRLPAAAYSPHITTLRKGQTPRIWKVSQGLIAQLNALPENDRRIFGSSSIDSMKSMFLNLRKKLAIKLQNPRLMNINFHSFRHWKAAMLFHQTKDPYYVKDFLGHKSLKNTEIYITVERTVFGESENDEFTVKVAEKPEEKKVTRSWL
jgi:integrase